MGIRLFIGYKYSSVCITVLALCVSRSCVNNALSPCEPLAKWVVSSSNTDDATVVWIGKPVGCCTSDCILEDKLCW